jgi:hypothetical protein
MPLVRGSGLDCVSFEILLWLITENPHYNALSCLRAFVTAVAV